MSVACELVARRRLYFDIAKKASGNSERGADPWTRITNASIDSPEYLFVVERFPHNPPLVSPSSADQFGFPAVRQRTNKSRGCLLQIFLAAFFFGGGLVVAIMSL
jgi:hypothetical protein